MGIVNTIGMRIPEEWKQKETWILFAKRVLYTYCFFRLCQIDQIMGSATGAVQYAVRNQIGLLMAAIILSAYHIRDFFKIPYFVWLIVFALGRGYMLKWGRENYWNQEQWMNIVCNVGVYGIIIIRLFYKNVIEKNWSKMNWPFFGVWVVMLLLMIFSKSTHTWPLWFLIMFGAFYMTDFSKKDLEMLFIAMVDGLIIGFFWIQIQACMYRPYDELRYKGMYANCNINGLFYVVSYCAFLCKWYKLKLKNSFILWRTLTVFFMGAIWGLAFFTMGRTTLVTMGIATVLFTVFMARFYDKHKMLKAIGTVMAILTAIVISFLPTFYCVRYIPAIIHAPIYFEGERTERKVQAGDSIDSEKYTELNELIEASFGRILWFVDFTKEQVKQIWEPAMTVYAVENADAVATNSQEEIEIMPGDDEFHPMLEEPRDFSDPIKVRGSIYGYYWKHLNLFGHAYSANGVWITPKSFAPHAHNVFLQMAFDFGIVSGILFLGISLLMFHTVLKTLKEEKQAEKNYRVLVLCLFTIVLTVFGMLEFNWWIGYNSFTMFFVVQYLVYNKGGLQDKHMIYGEDI